MVKILKADIDQKQIVLTGNSGDNSFQIDGDKSLNTRNMVSNSISDDDVEQFSRSRMKNKHNMATFLGNKFKNRTSPKTSLGQSFFGGKAKENPLENSMIEPIKPVIPSGLKKSQAELGYVDHSQSLKSKNRGFTIRFKDRQQQQQ